MSRILITALGFAAASSLAFAQQAEPSLKEVMEAIKGVSSGMNDIRKEVGDLRKEVDAVKAGAAKSPAAMSAPPAAQAPAATSQPATAQAASPPPAPPPKVSGQLRPGWVVTVVNKKNYREVDYSADPIGIFVYNQTRFHSQIHAQAVPTNNPVAYKAEGYIRIEETGRYIFSIKSQNYMECDARLSIDDNEFLKTDLNKYMPAGQHIQSGINLSAGDYRVLYLYACFHNESGSSTSSLEVRAPGEFVARELRPGEILHIARPGQRSSVDTPSTPGRAASSAANPTPPAPGSTRMVKSEVNVRQQPSTAAPVVATLDPGNRLRIAALSSDQQWAQVEINGQRIGFIRVTALNLNTH